MGTTLTGKRVQNTYDSLLKLSNNDNLTGTAQIVTDGLGNDSPIYLSTTRVGIGVSPTYEFQTNSNAKIGGNLIVGGNLTVNGTTTIVDSTVVAIGDNMIEMAKDNVANTMDIGWYGTIVESGTKFIGMKYDAGSGVTTPEFHIGLGTVEPGSTAEWTVKGKLVIGAIDSTGGTFSGQITIPETPTADGHAASKKYVDDSISDGAVDKAEKLYLLVRNDEGANLSAGDPIYSKGEIGNSERINVGKADASNPNKMPAIGIVTTDLNTTNNKDGEAIVSGIYNENLTGFSGLNLNDILYVASGGGLTKTKPTATNHLIQNVGIILKTNGTIIQGLKVSTIGRTNDVPNEVDRDLSIAGTLKVDDEIQVEADSGYGRLEVGGPDGGYIDLKTPFSDDYDLRIITNSSGSEFTGSGDFNINAGNTLTLTLDGSTQDATFAGNIGVSGKSPTYGISLGQGTSNSNKIVWTDFTPSFRGSIFSDPSDDKFKIATPNTSNVETVALEIDTSQNVTFNNNVIINGTTGLSIPNGRIDLSDGTTYDSLINANSSLVINIDADNNSTGETFKIATNSNTTTGGNALFTINESATATFAGQVHIDSKPNSGLAYNVLIDVGSAGDGTIGYQTVDQLAANIGASSSSNWVKSGNDIYNTNSGNVGIGTNSMYSNGLTIQGNSDDYSLIIAQSNAANAGYGFKSDTSGNFNLARLSGGSFLSAALITQLNTNNIIIPSKLMVGSTSTPSHPLTIQTDSGASSLAIIGRNNGTSDEAVISFYEYDQSTRNIYILKEGGDLAVATGTGGSAIERFRINSSGLVRIQKNTASTTEPLLKLSNASGSTTDGVKMIFEIANTSGNGGEIAVVRDGGSFNPYMTFNVSSGVASAPTERVRIDSSGRIGCGIQSPAARLDVLQETRISYLQGNQYRTRITNTDGNTRILSDGQQCNIIFGTTGNVSGGTASEKMRLDWQGNLGIGTESTNQKITIGFADNGTDGISFRSTTYASLGKILCENDSSSTNGNLQFHTRSGGDIIERLRIDSSGNLILQNGAVTLNKSDGIYIDLRHNNSTRGYLGIANQVITGGSTADLALTATTTLVFGSGGTQARMRIGPDGVVYIGGTSDYSGKFIVEQGGNSNGIVLNNTNTTPPRLYLRDAGGATYSEILANNDLVFNASQFKFNSSNPLGFYFNTTSASYGAYAVFQSQGSTKGELGYNASAMYFGGFTGVNTILMAGASNIMYLKTNGKVGIGAASSPDETLHIKLTTGDPRIKLETGGGGDPGIIFQSANNRTGEIFFQDGSTSARFSYDHSALAFKMYAHNQTVVDFYLSETTAYFPTQKVGIGHTTPQFGLTLAQGTGDGNRIGWEDGGNNKRASIICSSSTDALQFHMGTSDTERMRLQTNGDLHADGDVVAYSTTISDARLKDNVVNIDKALEKVKQLRGVEYVWNKGSKKGQKDLGVIAQEVEEILPEIVKEKEMAFFGEETYKTVDYEKLTAVLIESVKELSAKVEALQNKKCNCNCK